ncbi:DNA polymerase/3'-5' exonuclease PolX [Candidatus Woesearchaeota archaeon]|nr:DNA polymerase/3'-5' exonuclease PolX [Candidatus Woesearchaeota archaeon]
MDNVKVAKLLFDIADLLEMKGEEFFKPRAYRRAAMNIESMNEDIQEIWKDDKLLEIPGVGKGIAEKIEEYLKTGKCRHYEELKKKMPIKVDELMNIQGLGPKKLMLFYRKLRITDRKSLEQALKEGKIRKLKGMGEKVEQNLLKSLQMHKTPEAQRMLLGYALPIARQILARLKSLPEVEQLAIAGSLRRMKETIGDVDILVSSSKPAKVMAAFTAMPNVARVLAKGETKSSIIIKDGMQVDLRIIPRNSWGSALAYFTGSKDHNIEMRRIALSKGMKLSEYGLFKGNRQVAGRTEEELYNALGLDYVEPELREMTGEIDASYAHKLPKLVKLSDIRCDLQLHSNWSDGNNSMESVCEQAIKLGYEFIAMTDHVGSLKIANSIDEKRFSKYLKEIEKLNEKYKGRLTILKGAECNITDDGSIDFPSSCLKQLDLVLISLHSGLKQDKQKITSRILKAMDNPYVTIFAHPTARKIGVRPPVDFDYAKVFEKAKARNIFLETNAYPDRLDLRDMDIKAAIRAGCRISIGTDAHYIEQMHYMELGVAQARRGWAEKKDVINTLPLKEFLKAIKR